MSLWLCTKHGLYGGQVFCPRCGKNGEHVTFRDRPKQVAEPVSRLELHVGDDVEKVKGYKWPGVVVAVFETLAGDRRYVVECTVPEVAGALHIYSRDQLDMTFKPDTSNSKAGT